MKRTGKTAEILLPRPAKLALPAVFLTVSVGVNSAFQLASASEIWSPFLLLDVGVHPKVGYFYLLAVIGIWLGTGLSIVFSRRTLKTQITTVIISVRRLRQVTRILFLILLLMFIVTQIELGSANLLNLWRGQVSALDVENALKLSSFGIHGLGLLVAYAFLLCWHVNRLAAVQSSLAAAGIVLASLYFLSNGKAQGMVYVAAAYLFQRTAQRGIYWRIILATAVIAILFVITRLARNQSNDVDLDVYGVLLLAVGFYFGSPVSNTSFIMTNGLEVNALSAFFANFIPQKIVSTVEFFDLLPDPTSPVGLAGSALLLGGLAPAFVYFVCTGYLAQHVYQRSSATLASCLFMPFLFVACTFAMMYNHFMNLTFFWIPLCVANVMSAHLIALRGNGIGNSIAVKASPSLRTK